MTNYRIVLSLIVLILVSIACQTTSSSNNSNVEPAHQDPIDTGATKSYKWPIPEGAYSIGEDFVGTAGEIFYFQVHMSLEDIRDFYITEMQAWGYGYIKSTDGGFPSGYLDIWFDGHESGRLVLITVTDIERGNAYVTIDLYGH